MKIVFLAVVVCLVVRSQQHYVTNEYRYWSHPNISSTQLFTIDHDNQQIILTATNSLCHISLDLTETYNIINASPSDREIYVCQTDGDIFQPLSLCQNFHHVLLFPNHGSQSITIEDTNTTIPVNETVLICSSYAYQPRCLYRNKTDLTILANYSGIGFSAQDSSSITTSLISNDGELVSATTLGIDGVAYRLTISQRPFNGTPSITTIENNAFIFNSPTVVLDIYEQSNSYYIFTREDGHESSDDVIYSRVSRVCKNDDGIITNDGERVFTTYLTARIVCQADGNIPYNYNNLQDTVLISDDTNNQIQGEHLYGIFTSPDNGPAGSALCVYGFDSGDEIHTVFGGMYIEETGENVFSKVTNLSPIECDSDSNGRSSEDAKRFVLMADIVKQDEDDPLLTYDGILFKRLLVDMARGANDKYYEVLLVAAVENDELKLLQMTSIPGRQGDKTVISRRVLLAREGSNAANQQVGKMELYKDTEEILIFISTDDGIYSVQLDSCSIYTNCSECLSSQDPYCGYNMDIEMCVSMHDTKYSNHTILQDIDNGNSSQCPVVMATATPTPSNTVGSTAVRETSVEYTTVCSSVYITTTVIAPQDGQSTVITSYYYQPRSTVTQLLTSTVRPRPSTTIFISTDPTIGGVATAGINDTTWIIVAGCGGFIMGVVIGLLLFALVRNRNKYLWGKLLSRNNHYDFSEGEEKIHRQYENNNGMELKTTYNNTLECNGKLQSTRPSTPPLTKLNPTSSGSQLPRKVTDSPVLSKYSNTDRKHNRSMSSGGSFAFPGFEPITAPPVVGSPMGNNLRETYYIEESVSNNERQKYGKNVVGRQLSKEYPMSVGPSISGTHSKSHSLDLDHDYFNPPK